LGAYLAVRLRDPVVAHGLPAYAVLTSESGHGFDVGEPVAKFTRLVLRESSFASLVLAPVAFAIAMPSRCRSVSEVLGFLWEEFDPQAKTIVVSGRIVWAKGEGLLRTSTLDSSKGTAPMIALPQFAVDMLVSRAKEERLNLH
jgi:hypothetical protein